MADSSSSQQQGDGDRRAIGAWQTFLEQYCAENQFSPPIYSIASDRRGGRTAWSAAVLVNGRSYPARYWYDGNYITSAKEDAAQTALKVLETHEQFEAYQAEYDRQLQQQNQQVQQAHHGQHAYQGQGGSGSQSPATQHRWQSYGP